MKIPALSVLACEVSIFLVIKVITTGMNPANYVAKPTNEHNISLGVIKSLLFIHNSFFSPHLIVYIH